MHALVIYESMFGSTHELANAIAGGLSDTFDVDLVRADDIDPAAIDSSDLLVVGAPTHAHTLSTDASRHDATTMTSDADGDLRVEEPVMTQGLREWLDSLDHVTKPFAAFDTRSDMPRLLTGASSKRIDRELRKKGAVAVVAPESFLVTRFAGLKQGEAERGRQWGEQVARAASGPAKR
ncbi:MAG: flavodoxin domain-containing protein [Mycetocola sp.]